MERFLFRNNNNLNQSKDKDEDEDVNSNLNQPIEKLNFKFDFSNFDDTKYEEYEIPNINGYQITIGYKKTTYPLEQSMLFEIMYINIGKSQDTNKSSLTNKINFYNDYYKGLFFRKTYVLDITIEVIPDSLKVTKIIILNEDVNLSKEYIPGKINYNDNSTQQTVKLGLDHIFDPLRGGKMKKLRNKTKIKNKTKLRNNRKLRNSSKLRKGKR
jgi:hypothetical protein